MATPGYKQDTTETGKPAALWVKNVLYATDFSPVSEAALPYAIAICRKFASTLHIAHIISDTGLLLMTGGVDYVSFGSLYEDTNTIAKEKIGAIVPRLGGIPFSTHLRHGRVWPQLKNILVHRKIDLIVVGTSGRGGMEKLLLGSVAENILRHAPCPVLTVGPEICSHARLLRCEAQGTALAPVDLELRHILCAAKLTPESQQVASIAIKMAQEFAARLTLMHVIEYSTKYDVRPTLIDDTRERLQALVTEDASLRYAPETVTQFGSAWHAIVNEAKQREADLIVLGARAAEHATHTPWSTMHQVVAHASCPVLTVRA